MESRLYFVHALSSLHVGVGQGVGAIDLPIAREKSTRLPYLPGSGLKGNLRDAARAEGEAMKEKVLAVFGPETSAASDHAGALMVGDAHLVCLPVRSLAGTFAWATCPMLLRRLSRDAAAAGVTAPEVPVPGSETAGVAESSVLKMKVGNDDALVLEEQDLRIDAKVAGAVKKWADWLAERVFNLGGPTDAEWRKHFAERFAVLPDEVFDFLSETGTEVTARIRIDPLKHTVAPGALWYEESLPMETILVGVAAAEPSRRDGVKLTAGEVLDVAFGKPRERQIGGKAGVGRGRCRIIPVKK